MRRADDLSYTVRKIFDGEKKIDINTVRKIPVFGSERLGFRLECNSAFWLRVHFVDKIPETLRGWNFHFSPKVAK